MLLAIKIQKQTSSRWNFQPAVVLDFFVYFQIYKNANDNRTWFSNKIGYVAKLVQPM